MVNGSKTALAALWLALGGTSAVAGTAAGLMCFDRAEMSVPLQERSFVIVMEQTNPEVQDGAVLLDPQTFKEDSPNLGEMSFRVRVFSGVSALIATDLAPVDLGALLMSSGVPSGAYREWKDGVGRARSRKLDVLWDLANVDSFELRGVEYVPHSKDAEFYMDTVTGTDSRDVTCLPPYLSS